jgi:hypothetical protein
MLADYRLVVSPLVTVSDASSSGLGGCYSIGASNSGSLALQQLHHTLPLAQGDKLGVTELFGGNGGLRRALELLGAEPGIHIYADNKNEARRVVQAEWPETHMYEDVCVSMARRGATCQSLGHGRRVPLSGLDRAQRVPPQPG